MKSERMQVIVTELITEFNAAPAELQKTFRDCPKDGLTRFHHSLGQYIRNKYKLWEDPWESDMVNGVDMSENHPDAVSMEIIRQLWDKVQNI